MVIPFPLNFDSSIAWHCLQPNQPKGQMHHNKQINQIHNSILFFFKLFFKFYVALIENFGDKKIMIHELHGHIILLKEIYLCTGPFQLVFWLDQQAHDLSNKEWYGH